MTQFFDENLYNNRKLNKQIDNTKLPIHNDCDGIIAVRNSVI